jgi:WD40 repeat protein
LFTFSNDLFLCQKVMNYELKKSFDCNQGAIRAVRYNVDGNYCLSCGSDRKIKLFNPKTGLMIKVSFIFFRHRFRSYPSIHRCTQVMEMK